MVDWIKNLGLSVKNYLEIAALAFVGSLFVLLRLKDSEIHKLEIENMKQKFKSEDEKAADATARAEKEFQDAKKDLDN